MSILGQGGGADSHAERIVGLYERHARAWDTRRGRSLMEKPWLDAFASLLPPGASVLDLGCGSGEPIAAHLVAEGFGVTGVDSAPALIALCRERFPDHAWIVADMRTLSLGRRFDGVIAWDSFFHLAHDDQRRMFDVFAEHAAPGAPLLFTSGPAHGEAMGEFEGEPLYHASLDAAEYRALLAMHGFGVVRHVVEDPECGNHTIWLARQGR
ncbi:MAG TPA: class I SAM-dependent methyltransferase [Longimicrobium sp.]|nr:class I SAM-dependent methyltransferase [Longimicrobium sp.]